MYVYIGHNHICCIVKNKILHTHIYIHIDHNINNSVRFSEPIIFFNTCFFQTTMKYNIRIITETNEPGVYVCMYVLCVRVCKYECMYVTNLASRSRVR